MNAKKPLISLAVFLLSAFVIVYAMIQLISGLTTDVSYEYVSLQKVEKTLEKSGYLLRNETVLYAENEGILSYSVSESQKVGVDQLIANVYSNANGISVQNQINAIEQKIAILSRSAVDSSYLTSNVSKIDDKIFDSLIESKASVENNDLSLVPKVKEELLINMNKRQLVTSGKDDFSDQIAELQAQKDKLTASLQTPLSSVYAKETGYFSTILDGYETVFTPDKLQDMTLADFDAMVSAPQTEYTDSAIGKLVTDFDWFTLCEVTSDEAESFVIGKTYPVTYLYSSGQQLSAVLQQKITQTDTSRAVLIFLIEEVPSDFDYTRQQTIRIVMETKEGISFPSSALRLVDGVQGVYIVAGNVVEFKKVEIIDSSDSKYLSKEFAKTDENAAEFLSKFDRVILEGKNLYVGKILD